MAGEERYVPWYRDPGHGAHILLAAAVGLGLAYLTGGNRVLFYGVLALGLAAIAAYATLYLSVVVRMRRLVRNADRVLGRVSPPADGEDDPAATAEPGAAPDRRGT